MPLTESDQRNLMKKAEQQSIQLQKYYKKLEKKYTNPVEISPKLQQGDKQKQLIKLEDQLPKELLRQPIVQIEQKKQKQQQLARQMVNKLPQKQYKSQKQLLQQISKLSNLIKLENITESLELVNRYTHNLSPQEQQEFMTSMDYSDTTTDKVFQQSEEVQEQARKYGPLSGGGGYVTRSSKDFRDEFTSGLPFGCKTTDFGTFFSDYKPLVGVQVLIPSIISVDRVNALKININAYLALGVEEIIIFYYGEVNKVINFITVNLGEFQNNPKVKFVLYSYIGSPHVGIARMAIARYLFTIPDNCKVIISDDRRFIGAPSKDQIKSTLDAIMQQLHQESKVIISPAKNFDTIMQGGGGGGGDTGKIEYDVKNYPTQIVFSTRDTLKEVYENAQKEESLPACFSRIMEDYSFATLIPDEIQTGYCKLISRTTLKTITTTARGLPKNYLLAKIFGNPGQQSLKDALRLADPHKVKSKDYRINRGRGGHFTYINKEPYNAATRKYIDCYLGSMNHSGDGGRGSGGGGHRGRGQILPKPLDAGACGQELAKYWMRPIQQAALNKPDILKIRVDDYVDIDGSEIRNPFNRQDLINFIYQTIFPILYPKDPQEDTENQIIDYFIQQKMFISIPATIEQLHQATIELLQLRTSDPLRLYRLNKEYLVDFLLQYNKDIHNTPYLLQKLIDELVDVQKGSTHYQLEQTDSQISELQQLEDLTKREMYPSPDWNPTILINKCKMVVPGEKKGTFKQCGNLNSKGDYCSKHEGGISSYALFDIRNYYHLILDDFKKRLPPYNSIKVHNQKTRLENTYGATFKLPSADSFIYYDSVIELIRVENGYTKTLKITFKFVENVDRNILELSPIDELSKSQKIQLSSKDVKYIAKKIGLQMTAEETKDRLKRIQKFLQISQDQLRMLYYKEFFKKDIFKHPISAQDLRQQVTAFIAGGGAAAGGGDGGGGLESDSRTTRSLSQFQQFKDSGDSRLATSSSSRGVGVPSQQKGRIVDTDRESSRKSSPIQSQSLRKGDSAAVAISAASGGGRGATSEQDYKTRIREILKSLSDVIIPKDLKKATFDRLKIILQSYPLLTQAMYNPLLKILQEQEFKDDKKNTLAKVLTCFKNHCTGKDCPQDLCDLFRIKKSDI